MKVHVHVHVHVYKSYFLVFCLHVHVYPSIVYRDLIFQKYIYYSYVRLYVCNFTAMLTDQLRKSGEKVRLLRIKWAIRQDQWRRKGSAVAHSLFSLNLTIWRLHRRWRQNTIRALNRNLPLTSWIRYLPRVSASCGGQGPVHVHI